MRCGSWTSTLILTSLNKPLLIRELTTASWLLASSTTTLLRKQLIAFLKILRADGLSIRESLLLLTLVAIFGISVRIINVEHVFDVL